MRKTGIATSHLHGGRCPPWLFQKMVGLSAAIVEAIVAQFGTTEVLRRFSEPVWFQSFGNVLGFDWQSSGLTTVVLAALKEGLRDRQGELGLFIAGGKGRISRQTPQEIHEAGSRYGLAADLDELERFSRLSAKVDSAAVQDGYQLYHHVFLFDKLGHWAVVQQGMQPLDRTARRYHWLGQDVTNFVIEPHAGVVGQTAPHVLNLTSQANTTVQQASLELSEHPGIILDTLRKLKQSNSTQTALTLPKHHAIPSAARLDKILYSVYERAPSSYQSLLELQGVGPSTLRALAMVAEVVHGVPISYQDPVRYTFAHGGKDAHPFPVNRQDYKASLETLRTALQQAKLGRTEKLAALKRLSEYEPTLGGPIPNDSAFNAWADTPTQHREEQGRGR